MKKLAKNTASILAAGMIATSAQAIVMFEDDFNTYSEGTYISGTSSSTLGSNWRVTHGSVDVVAPGGIWESLNQPGYGGFIDLDGSTGSSGRMVTLDKFLFEAGVSYTLTFDLAGDQRNDGVNRTASFVSTIGDGISNNPLLREVISLSSNEAFDSYSYSFIGTGYDGRLGFSATLGPNQNDNVGLLLDNVKLETTQVAEPATLTLFALGIVGIGLVRYRQRTAQS